MQDVFDALTELGWVGRLEDGAYALLARLRAAFPAVEIEACAGERETAIFFKPEELIVEWPRIGDPWIYE